MKGAASSVTVASPEARRLTILSTGRVRERAEQQVELYVRSLVREYLTYLLSIAGSDARPTRLRCHPALRITLLRGRTPARGRLDAVTSSKYTTGRLEAATWDSFADLVERNNGIYGGCWCAPNHVEYERGVSDTRTLKEQLVRSGRARAALVFDEEGMRRAGASTASRTPWISSTAASTARTLRRRRSGESRASSWTSAIAGKGSPGWRSRERSARSPTRVAGASRRSPRPPRVVRHRAASSSARRSSCSRTSDSRASAKSASTRGS